MLLLLTSLCSTVTYSVFKDKHNSFFFQRAFVFPWPGIIKTVELSTLKTPASHNLVSLINSVQNSLALICMHSATLSIYHLIIYRHLNLLSTQSPFFLSSLLLWTIDFKCPWRVHWSFWRHGHQLHFEYFSPTLA